MAQNTNPRRLIADATFAAMLDPASGVTERSLGVLQAERDERNPYAAVVTIEGRKFRVIVKEIS